MKSLEILSRSQEETAAVAVAVAPELRAGDVVLLSGGLAAGKTYFVQALARALGSDEPVTSPTFSIANFYACDRAAILHIDTYRLASVAEFNDLALDAYMDGSITLIEWGERVSAVFPTHLAITIDVNEHDRALTIGAHGARWLDAVPAIAGRLGIATQ